MLNEFKLIEKLTSIIDINDPSVIVGFGDDCAGVKFGKEILLFSNDTQVENVHFLRKKIKPESLGWKLISVNVSDIVACGGFPKWCNITIGLPKDIKIEYIENIYTGIKKALKYYKFNLIGGNTTKSKELILDLFIVGSTDKFISRSTNKVGDTIYISDYVGLSRAGLELLLMDKEKYEDFELELIKHHTEPIARIDLVETIKKFATSCIDISDGLVSDLFHLVEKNGNGILIENIPIHPLLKRYCEKYQKNPIEYVLYGGEDYQLAFTVNSQDTFKISKNLLKIGKIIEEEGIFLKKDGKVNRLELKGYSHL